MYYRNAGVTSHPPSITNSLPVEYDDSSDVRNSTRRATSSGSPIRGMGSPASGFPGMPAPGMTRSSTRC